MKKAILALALISVSLYGSAGFAAPAPSCEESVLSKMSADPKYKDSALEVIISQPLDSGGKFSLAVDQNYPNPLPRAVELVIVYEYVDGNLFAAYGVIAEPGTCEILKTIREKIEQDSSGKGLAELSSKTSLNHC